MQHLQKSELVPFGFSIKKPRISPGFFVLRGLCKRFAYVIQSMPPIPPMPPIPGPPAPPADSFLGASAIIVSVVNINDETDAAFVNAQRTTFTGSITPSFNKSVYSSV